MTRKTSIQILKVLALALTLFLLIPAFGALAEEEPEPADTVEESPEPHADGWDDETGSREYWRDGEKVTQDIVEIDGSLYAFDWEGRMLDDTTDYVYASSLDNGGYVRARSGGALYAGEWYSEQTEWPAIDENGNEYYPTINYYYGEDGFAANGLVTVEGQLRYFWGDGQMATDTTVTEDGTPYIIDSEGTLFKVQNGWNQVKGIWYYCENGEFAEGVKEIGGARYLFYNGGRMLDDDSIGMGYYDEETDEYIHAEYRAKKGGALITNDWYKRTSDYSDGWWYYYDADSKQVAGPATIDGQLYVFYEYGEMATDDTVTYDGTSYVCDSEGRATKLSPNGWSEVNGKWYFCENGVAVSGETRRIGGQLYFFRYDGAMLDDDTYYFSRYDEETETHKSVSYRAKSGGALYENAWYQEVGYYGEGGWYYYGADGENATGPLTIGGQLYFFSDGGRMITNDLSVYQGESYVTDENGNATKLNHSGWTQLGGYWYYTVDGEAVREEITQIGTAWYAFTWNGRMVTDETYMNARAKADGTLYVNQWYGWTWYGADARAAYGKQTVNGVTYYFGENGEAVIDEYVVDDGTAYYAGLDRVLKPVTADGLYVTNEGARVYLKNGALVKNAWIAEGGFWYYFQDNGIAAVRMLNLDGKAYYFNSDGTMATNTWIHYGSNTYYASADGSLLTGHQQIGGTWYYFGVSKFDGYGAMKTGLVIDDQGYAYIYAADGSYIGAANRDGWSSIDGTWYYAADGELYYGSNTIDGVNYFFDWDTGAMIANQRYGDRVYNASGAQVSSGWVQLADNWYYVNPSSNRIEYGDLTIGGKEYYIDYNGMATGERRFGNELRVYGADGALVSKSAIGEENGWKLFGGVYYFFWNGKAYTGWAGDYYIRSGRMLTNTITPDGYYVDETGAYVKSGWVDEEGEFGLYAKAGGKLAQDEWVLIGGTWYYFLDNYPACGPHFIDGVLYLFDLDGRLQVTVGANPADGWYSCPLDDGAVGWTYVQYGVPVRHSRQVIGGVEYLFDYYYLCDGGFWTYYGERDITTYVKADGTPANYVGWKQIDGSWYYFDNDGALLTGWVYLYGKTYYIVNPYYIGEDEGVGGMVTGNMVINGSLYTFGADGALQKQLYKQNGWLQADGVWYYFADGRLVTDGIRTIGGVTYGFSGGRLASNELIYGDYVYYANADGTIARNAWRMVDGEWMAFDANGRRLDGIRIIDGVTYYFNGGRYYY